MAKGKFIKGQTVYQACVSFASNDREVREAKQAGRLITRRQEVRIVSRTVDACGQKQVTFYDNGNDFVYGRAKSFRWNPPIFATAEEAFAYAREFVEARKNEETQYIINPRIYSDADPVVSVL